MEFKIINETAALFGDSILSLERQLELSKKLDAMVEVLNVRVQRVRVCNVMQDIASFCDTQEEFAYCIVLHMGWHQKKGHQIS